MQIKELKEQLAEEYRRHKENKEELERKFAEANNKIKKGDWVSDTENTILVDEIGISKDYNGTPMCVYSGFICRKDGTPSKRKTRKEIWQKWVTSINGDIYNYAMEVE